MFGTWRLFIPPASLAWHFPQPLPQLTNTITGSAFSSTHLHPFVAQILLGTAPHRLGQAVVPDKAACFVPWILPQCAALRGAHGSASSTGPGAHQGEREATDLCSWLQVERQEGGALVQGLNS